MRITANILIGAMALFFGSTVAYGQADVIRAEISDAALSVEACGADFSVTGSLHEVVNIVSDGNGGSHIEDHKFYWIRATVGDDVLRGTARVFSVFNNGLGTEFTAITDVNLVGQGSIPNLLIRVVAHTTVNANGTTTAEVTNLSCPS